MFKLLTIAVLLYLLYRVVFPPSLNQGENRAKLDQKDEEGEYIDYEEVD